MSIYDQYLSEKNTNNQSTGTIYSQYLADKKAQQGPSLISKVFSGIKDYANESANTATNFLDAVKSPWKTIQKTPSLFTEPLMAAEQKAGEGLATITNNYGMDKTSIPEKIAGTAKLITGLAESAFSPVTGLFHLADSTPGLKQVADTINIPFTAAGFAGSWGTGKVIDWIPDSIVSKESKDIIKQPLQEAGSLASQIFIGGKIMKGIEEKISKRETITPESTKKLVDTVKTEIKNNPKIIEKPKVSVYEQYKNDVQKISENRNLKTEILGENKVINTRAKILEESAIERKLTEGFKELQTHTQMNMAEQARLASDFIQSDLKKAKEIALGNSPSINGVLPESIYTALEIKAIRDGDVGLIKELVQSKLPTYSGQALKALDSVDPNSPVKIMRDITKAREETVKKRTGKDVAEEKVKVVKEIKEKIPKVKKQTWDQFLEEIKCSY